MLRFGRCENEESKCRNLAEVAKSPEMVSCSAACNHAFGSRKGSFDDFRNRAEEMFPLPDSCFCIQKSRIRQLEKITKITGKIGADVV